MFALRVRAALPAVALLLHLPPAAAAPGSLPRTRQVLAAVEASFVGEPTRAELLAGGLKAITRLEPGLAFKMEGVNRVVFSAGKKQVAFDTARMLTHAQVVAAFEKAIAMAKPRIPPTEVDDAVASGLVMSLEDRHSAYLRPYFVERLGYSEGELLGDPGIELGVQGARIIVKSVAPGSSAALAGVKPMTLLRRVDDTNVDGLSLGEAGALLLGASGSNVELVLEPRGDAEPIELKLARDPPFALQPHINMLGDVVHVVPGPLLGHSADAVRNYLAAQKTAPRGVILDFRGNGGGRVGDAVALADIFIPAGPLANVVSRQNRPVQRFEARSGDIGEKVPVVVLVDGRSASAVELASLVLRERLKAPILGVQTYGKGSVQKLIPVDGGGYLKITAAMYMTSAGTTVGEGIIPDTALPEETYPRRGQEGKLDTDPWLKAAYDALPAAGAPPAPAPR